MPLPEYGIEWPPKPFDQAQREMRTWNAWYNGDTSLLEEIYRETNQSKGGWLGKNGDKSTPKTARFFWGRDNPASNQRIHVPAPADVSRTIADLLFAQPPQVVIGEDDAVGNRELSQKRMNKLFGEDDTMSCLLEAAELASALGGAYLRLWWDRSISDKVRIGQMPADSAIPTWRYDTLAAVTFWTIVRSEDDTVWRHLERHEPGRILHGLYEGDRGRLGRVVPLQDSAETEWAAGLVDENGAILTGVPGLTATYIPNVRPNRKWRNTTGLAQLGRSDYDGLEPLFDALDETQTSWLRDLDLGKARLFVDETMLKSMGAGNGKSFDTERAIFTAVGAGLGSAASGGLGVMANQFSIRWEEHSKTEAEILNAILRGVGLSTSSFSENSLTAGVTQTATEVNSKDRLSERSRDKRIGYWKASLRPFTKTTVDLDNAVFGSGVQLKDLPEVRFPIRPQQNPAELATNLATLRSVQLVSIEQGIRQQHPNWSSDDVNDEYDRIRADEKVTAALTMGFGGEDDESERELAF